MNPPLLFQPSPDAVYGFPRARLVERVESRYQTIEIWDTPQLGALFTLDGRPMTSAGDEFIYHECMVHPAALAHPAPRAALVLGGGDGGAARQLLKHPGIERIVVAELDAEVVRLTRQYLPDVQGGAFDDPRVELVIGDAADYVAALAAATATDAPANTTTKIAAAAPGAAREGTPQPASATPPEAPRFDLVVFDLTPPDSPAAGLYTPAFYAQLKRVLSADAALSLHLGSPYFHAPRIAGLLDDLRASFAHVRMLSTFVPLYGSLWTMAIASATLDPAALTATTLAERVAARGIDSLRHYEPALHAGLFSATRSVRDKLSPLPKLSR
ncbi:spermidine synthase [Paraburkholderia antibiotica]|uniref:Polyamine aminopropyltransferase n=1 Tax=Paraburkholderia antibiotica TaxID=2728839 RepID=A0A7X9X8W3_9BURK|nr:spermidine synthase [Paraburkholderia antibiotica]NML33662.1 spermidine synthase [Paraburkholderia antibiotica]